MNKNMGYLLIVIGILLVVAGVVFVNKSSNSEDYTTTQKVIKKTQIAEDQPEIAQSSSSDLSDAEQKGQDFEKYVVNNFSKKYFTIKEWRGDKYTNGRFAESSQYPDLELVFNYQGEEYLFAVECKWRSRFNNDGFVHWCNDDQLERYNNFAKEKSIPVFIILGLGGTPSDPENVYAVPLNAMKFSDAKKEYLEEFRHDNSKKFYFNHKEKRLY